MDWKHFLEEVIKSRWMVTVLGMLAAALGPKLGIPPESLTEFFIAIGTLVVGYVGGKSYSDPREAAARAGAKPNP